MQENLSELSKKYQEEMLRLYGKRQPEAVPASAEPQSAPEPPQPVPEPEPPQPAPEPEQQLEDIPEITQEELDEEFPEDIYGDEKMPVYIRPVPELPEEWTAQEAYEKANTAQGYLRVVTAAADSAYPVPGARVSVFTRIGKKLHLSYLMVTDENGETPTVSLPAPPAGLSQEPENAVPYASCDIRIAAKGYFPTQAADVHIFAGVTTRQVFQLVPLPVQYEPSDGNIDPNEVGRTEDCQGDGVC